MNEIILTNVRLVRDPELTYTKSQTPVCNFSVACNDGYGDNKKVYFFNIVTWKQQAENCGKYLKKGSPVNIKGSLVQNIYTNKDGIKKNNIKINASYVEFVSTKNKGDELQPKAEKSSLEEAGETVKKAVSGKEQDFPDMPDDDPLDPNDNDVPF